MTVHSFRRIQNIPAASGTVWSFFTDPANLLLITPPQMKFSVLFPTEEAQIYAGQLIEYKLRPLPLFRVYWMTEIAHVQEGHYFIDEQRRGPYRLWHHQHHFKPIPGGVEMTDIVHYELPFGFLGNWANALFVRRQLEGIFAYRFNKIEELFGKYT